MTPDPATHRPWTTSGVSTGRLDALATATLVAVGALLLAARAWTAPLGGAARIVAALVLFGGILAASLVVPQRPARPPAEGSLATRSIAAPRVGAVAAFAVGLAAIAGAAAAAGTPVPFAASAWILPVSILAAVAEEALFRRVAYGALERFGAIAAVVGSALLFAAVHAPLYGIAALPVDLGAGLLFGWQRWATGSWTTPAATHAVANVVAVLR